MAARAPSVARPALAAPTADGVDAAALSFHVAQSLAQQEKEKAEEEERAKVQKLKEEEEERRMQRINAKVRDDLPLTHEEHEAWRRSASPRLLFIVLSCEEEEEEEEEEAASSSDFLSLSSWPRSSSTAAVACLQRWVFLVTFLFALCFLRLSSGLGCSASWPVWTRRTVMRFSGSGMRKARVAGFTPRSVFPLVVGRPAGRSVWTRITILQLAIDVPVVQVYRFRFSLS